MVNSNNKDDKYKDAVGTIMIATGIIMCLLMLCAVISSIWD